MFANGPGDLGSIPGRVIPKTLKMELDTTLLNTQHYKVRFKGKVEQSREWSSALPSTMVANFTYIRRESSAFDEKTGVTVEVKLQKTYLCDVAIPRILPNCPSYKINIENL